MPTKLELNKIVKLILQIIKVNVFTKQSYLPQNPKRQNTSGRDQAGPLTGSAVMWLSIVCSLRR